MTVAGGMERIRRKAGRIQAPDIDWIGSRAAGSLCLLGGCDGPIMGPCIIFLFSRECGGEIYLGRWFSMVPTYLGTCRLSFERGPCVIWSGIG